MKDVQITHVGGSDHHRSLHSALLIALGAGFDPKVLASHSGLGNEEEFFAAIGTDMNGYKAALAENNNCDIDTFRSLCSPDAYIRFRLNMGHAIRSVLTAASDQEGVVLGSHSPWLPLLMEYLSKKEYRVDARELDYIVVDVFGDGAIRLVETSMPMP